MTGTEIARAGMDEFEELLATRSLSGWDISMLPPDERTKRLCFVCGEEIKGPVISIHKDGVYFCADRVPCRQRDAANARKRLALLETHVTGVSGPASA